jgi:Centromere DNA-binding protein complex CBF3 subunit, domain 2
MLYIQYTTNYYFYIQILKTAHWEKGTAQEVYLSRLSLSFMRRTAGFQHAPGGYFLPRAGVEPPQSLKRLIFPWLEDWEVRFKNRAAGKRWKDGGLDEDDIAGQQFLKLLKQLRIVLLQDLAVLQPSKCLIPISTYLFTNI